MAGASNYERQDAYVLETTAGTTPATPGFTKLSFETLSMQANPRISESYTLAANGQRADIARSGIAVSGQAQGKMIYGEYDNFLASMFQASWASNILINGYDQVTMTIEQAIAQGAGGAYAYTRFKGVEVVSGQIALTAGQDATISVDLIGSASDATATAIITGATYADPSNTAILGSGADIGTITMGAWTLDCMESCTIDFGVAEKTEQPKLSSNDLCGVNRGVMRPTITGRFYIEDNFVNIYDAARAGTEFALTIPIGSVSGQKYSIYFPACEFSEAPLEPGDSGPAFQTFTIMPKYHAATGGTCKITRAIV
ncbi:phage tail tube protein [Actibacterium sp. MT2.3-13A]|uniref:phage tail tube protein n=1 Tax=Actibacterium sp. MT2.3-13A TaxID=2828332 RepID=UPI001BA6407D|nr:phage tail tube protein [Actibacterium sp. MT2.3-13A]